MVTAPVLGEVSSVPPDDPFKAEKAAQEAATHRGFLTTVVPTRMTSANSYRVSAFVSPHNIVFGTATTLGELHTDRLPISTIMSVVLEGDHFKISGDGVENTKVGEQQRLLLTGGARSEWDWTVVPSRFHFAPITDEPLHLYFHVWFFSGPKDALGVEVTPPRERDLKVKVNLGSSLGKGWGNALVSYQGLGGVAFLTLVGSVLWKKKKRKKKPETERPPVSEAEPQSPPKKRSHRKRDSMQPQS